jgi:opacity protein-like surface antigen
MRATPIAAAGVLAIMAVAPANAADIVPPQVSKERPPRPLPPPVAPAYNWTGFYIGGNLGGGWARTDFSGTGSAVQLRFAALADGILTDIPRMTPSSSRLFCDIAARSHKATKYRLPEQPGQCVPTILAGTCVGQNITRHDRQAECVVEFTIGE